MIDRLGRIAADAAMVAAIDTILAAGRNPSDLVDPMVTALRKHVPAAIEPALADAKEALDAGMPQVAESTFLATMKMAGVAAAKEVLGA